MKKVNRAGAFGDSEIILNLIIANPGKLDADIHGLLNEGREPIKRRNHEYVKNRITGLMGAAWLSLEQACAKTLGAGKQSAVCSLRRTARLFMHSTG